MGQQTLPPGFRFSPTDEELVLYYLKSKALGKNSYQAIIANVDVYKYEPYDLPGKAALPSKDQEWFFYSAQDKKYSHTARINRTTRKGYWKATGKDRKVFSGSSVIGLKKTLIYYEGRAPNGSRTNWIMHEYRLDEEFAKKEGVVCVAVLCRIRKKGGPGPRNGEQYGAPILIENLEPEESIEKVDISIDTSYQDDVESRNVRNVYNLTDQVEIWKQMRLANNTSDYSDNKECKKSGFPKMESDSGYLQSKPNNTSDYSDNKECTKSGFPKMESDSGYLQSKPNEKQMVEGAPDLFTCLQSPPDVPNMAPIYSHDGDACLSCDQYLDVQNPDAPFHSEAFSYFHTLWDADDHCESYGGSAFDESEMLRDLSNLINDGQGVGGTGSTIQPPACNVLLDGDYIELDDIEPHLDGFALMPLKHNREPGRSEEQLLWSLDGTQAELEELLHSQGPAAQTAWMPTQTCYGRSESSQFVLSQGEKYNQGGYGKPSSGSYSGSGNVSHVVESANRIYLSKHVSTYEVSKHEMLPARPYYASSFTKTSKCPPTMSSPQAKPLPTSSATKGKFNVDADTARKLPTCPVGLPPLSCPANKSRRDRVADVFKKALPADGPRNLPSRPIRFPPSSSPCPINKSRRDMVAHVFKKASPPGSPPSSSSPLPKCNSSPDAKISPATQASAQKAENETMDYTNKHRWRGPFRVLVSRGRRNSLRLRLLELENGVRVKLNDKLSALGKPGARPSPTKVDTRQLESLVQCLLLETLCQVVAAMLIFSCLIWSFRVLVNRASSVSV